MKLELTKLATKFIKQAIMTEELDEVLQDTLNIISLLEQAFASVRKHKEEMPDFSEVSLLFRNLSEMEKEMTDPYFLEEELGEGKGEASEGLFNLRERATTIRHLVRGLPRKLNMFSNTNVADNKRIADWGNDLVYNIDRMINMTESKEHGFTEQDTRSPDELSLEEVHPHAPEQGEDYDDGDEDEEDRIERIKRDTILTDPAERAERLKARKEHRYY